MEYLIGNTYPIKDQIKSLGGRWNSEKKCWMIPKHNFEKAVELMTSKPKKVLSGQLWEPCPKCKTEPVYMSLDCYCERCG